MARAGRKARRQATPREQLTPGGDNHSPLEPTDRLGIPKKHWAITRRRSRLVKIVLGSSDDARGGDAMAARPMAPMRNAP